MYRIIIAEDEEDVRKTIMECINESETEFQVAAAAGDGVEAVELVKKLKPDILVTDICMPKLNGLELIRAVRETGLDIAVVVISGYDEFTYAQEAMRLGVREYLLKPFLPEELFEILEETKRLLEERSQLAKNIQRMTIQIERAKEYSRDYFLNLLLEGEPEAARQAGEELGLTSEDVWHCVAVVKGEAANGGGQDYQPDILGEYLEIIAGNYFEKDIRMYPLSRQGGQYVLLFQRSGKSAKRFAEDIRLGMEKICVGMEQYHKVRLTCALGNIYCEFEKIRESYHEACDIRRSALYEEKTVVAYTEIQKNGNQIDGEYEAELRNQMLLAVQMGLAEEARQRLAELTAYYAEFSLGQVEYISVSLVRLVLRISDAVEQAGGQIPAWNDERIITYLKRHFTSGSLTEARKVLEEYVEKCCAQLARMNEGYSDRIVNNARAIIDCNLDNEDFSLEMLAKELHFSSNYVRQLLKNKLGMNFSDYLLQKRMELAEALLCNPNYKIQCIAEKTGYSNPQYFARCFKKYYGCTPTSYRDSLSADNSGLYTQQ